MKLIRPSLTTSVVRFLSSKALAHSICNIRDPQTLLINSRIPTPRIRTNTPIHSLLHTLPIRVYRSIINPHILSQCLAPTVTPLQRYTTPHQVPTVRPYQGNSLPQVRN